MSLAQAATRALGAAPHALGDDPDAAPAARAPALIDIAFPTMGGRAHVVLSSATHSAEALDRLALAAAGVCADVEAHLSPFDPDSELSRFNRGEEERRACSPLLRRLAVAAREAGRATGGLVDATRAGELRRSDAPRAPLARALAAAPARRPAGPHPARAYETLAVSAAGRVLRAPGVTLDPGGLAKGMAADSAAALMPAGVRYAISVCGDLAAGGGEHVVAVEPSVPGARGGCVVRVPSGGGVATSGIAARLWRREDGSYAHHLLDPATGEPAWTGLVAVTAVADSALDAEVLAKHALLAGPRAARRLLARRGGVLHHEDGALEQLAPAPVVRLSVPA